MSNLLDPLIVDATLKGGAESFSAFSKINFTHIALNILLPLAIFLFIIFILKLKWDGKHNKNNLRL
jgi:hypothetical protein